MKHRPEIETGNSKLTQFMQGLIEQAEQYIEAEEKRDELILKVVQVLERNHAARGDDNHLRSPRYTHKRGQIIWIPPCIKGSGPYLPKSYVADSDYFRIVES
jgi:hypothetical protein